MAQPSTPLSKFTFHQVYPLFATGPSMTVPSRQLPSVITLGVSAMTTYPLYLNTRNPNVKSPRDFSDQDKIVVPSIKVSTQAIMLQMLAAKEFGDANYARFDPHTRERYGCID